MNKIKFIVNRETNYVFHMLSVSKCGYDNSYGDAYKHLYPQEDLAVLKNYEDLLTIRGGEHVGKLMWIILSGAIGNVPAKELYQDYVQKVNDGEFNTGKEFNYGLAMGKLPTCSWQSDLYTNYLTEQALNQGLGFVKSSVASVISGNPIKMITNIADVMVERKTHELVPPQARGTNTADVSFGMNKTRFTYYITQIRSEFARQIDDYLTKFGYKCNLLKIPNQTGRRYWNYVKISGDDDIAVGGVVPADAMEEINNIYRQGVTIWHDHANIGNYALDNTII